MSSLDGDFTGVSEQKKAEFDELRGNTSIQELLYCRFDGSNFERIRENYGLSDDGVMFLQYAARSDGNGYALSHKDYKVLQTIEAKQKYSGDLLSSIILTTRNDLEVLPCDDFLRLAYIASE